MREISIDLVQNGQVLARDIYNSRGNLLLSKGIALTKDIVNNLKKLGFTSLYINDGLIDDVKIDEIICEETRTQAIACLREISDNLRINDFLNLKVAKKAVSNIVDEVMQNNELLITLADIRSYDDYTFQHSVNVTIISVMIGSFLYYSYDKLFDLGLGVLLHDIGKIKLPLEILNKPDKLTTSEFEDVKLHTWYGYEILKKNSEIKLTSAHIALQHHEKVNGLGYPRGISGKDILEFAKICAIADVYDALSNNRVYKEKLTGPQVYEVLLQGKGSHFDAEILELFLQKIALYPNGTKVQLNDGNIGLIIKQDYKNPKRPVVRIFWNSKNEYIQPKEIVLINNPHLFILDVIKS